MFILISKTKKIICCNCIRYYSKKLEKCKPPWNILFFGTDAFSLASLKALNSVHKGEDTISRLEVVTSIKNKANPIYKFAMEQNLNIHRWPLTSSSGFHIGLVVSFGYLIPQNIIDEFPLGMVNVHASLLPRWRGAAPIIHAIANGDDKTGITIMRIKPKHFDTGEIVDQAAVNIENNITMPILYNRLSNLGADMLVKQLYYLPEKLISAKPQSDLGITFAPKVTSSFGIINWSTMSAKNIYNLSRALVGLYPLFTKWHEFPIKIHNVELTTKPESIDLSLPGSVFYDKTSKILKILCIDGNWISVKSVSLQNKRTISATDFNNGYIKKVEVNKRIFK